MSKHRQPPLAEQQEMWSVDEGGAEWQPAKGADPFATCADRRTFMKGGALAFGGLALAWPLQEFMARKAHAAGGPVASPYGDRGVDRRIGCLLRRRTGPAMKGAAGGNGRLRAYRRLRRYVIAAEAHGARPVERRRRLVRVCLPFCRGALGLSVSGFA